MRFLQGIDSQSDYYSSSEDNYPNSQTIDDIYPNRLFYEFILFLSPSMLFSLSAYYSLRKLNSNASGYMGDSLQNSLFVKCKLCKLQSIVYGLQFFVAIFLPMEIYWIAEFPGLGFLYIFGIVSWYLNSKLLNQEAELGLPQGLHHKLFWTISFLFSLWRLFLPYEVRFYYNINYRMMFLL